MGWFFLIVGALLVFAIAAAFVGSETFRLGHETPSAIFDMDEALQEVGDALPDEVQARLTYDELRRLILATLDHLESKGLAAAPGRDLRVIGERDEVVVADEDTVAMALRRVEPRASRCPTRTPTRSSRASSPTSSASVPSARLPDGNCHRDTGRSRGSLVPPEKGGGPQDERLL